MVALLVVVGVVLLMPRGSHPAGGRSSPPPDTPAPRATPSLGELAMGSAKTQARPRSRWPSTADYGGIVSARVVVHDSLRNPDWRQKSFGALLAIKALMTIHPLAPGRCASFVNRTYDELRDFLDAQPGENWAPMVAVVHHDPPVTVCRAPRRVRPDLTLTS
jgi:hypothetical protein